MTVRKLLKILAALLIVLIIIGGIVSINHPIFLKWLAGSARVVGKPIPVTVYTNGNINHTIKVFHVDSYWGTNEKTNTYLLALLEEDGSARLKFVNINLTEKWIGKPVGGSKKNYDFILDYLFQSETGRYSIPFQDAMNGFGFDPELFFTDKQIKFKMPPSAAKFDSVRVELE